jgi:hypothetical protein
LRRHALNVLRLPISPYPRYIEYMNKYTFVTISHQVDYQALCFQARSFAKYLPTSLLGEIIVIDNGITDLNRDHLLDQYGKLRDSVRVMEAAEILPKYALKNTGWFTQQLLKLLVCDHVKTERYVALDAKNTMVFPLKLSFLETDDGVPRSYLIDYTKHSSNRWLRHTLDYFELPDELIKSYMPVVTPYTFITALVKEMVAYLEHREQKPFPVTFIDNRLTEFYLYAGYLIHTDQHPYSFTQPECKIVFNTTSNFKWVKSWIVKTERDELPFFSVHRGATPSEGTKRAINGLWWRRGLK